MYIAWTQDIKDSNEKEQFERSLRNSRWILDKLSALLDDKTAELDRAEISLKSYETPSWEYKQADTNGYRRCLRDMKNLINLDQKEP